MHPLGRVTWRLCHTTYCSRVRAACSSVLKYPMKTRLLFHLHVALNCALPCTILSLRTTPTYRDVYVLPSLFW